MRPPFPLAAAALLLVACAPAWAAQAPAPPTAEQALRNTRTKVTLDAPNIPLTDVLRILSKQFDLSIITAKNVNTTVAANFKDVTLREALDSLVTINGFAYRTKGRIIEVYSPAAAEVALGEPHVETYALEHAQAQTLKELLKPFLSKEGKIEAEVGGNTLIVYDAAAVLETLNKVIKKIDRPEPQVTIGAEIIEASVSASEKLGIDWKTRVAASGSTRPITFPFSKKNSHSKWIPSNTPSGGGDDDDDEEFSPDDSFPYATREDFTFGTLDATGLQAILEVLKTDGGTNLVANPEITTLNNREAKINIGNTVPVPIYTTNLETGVSAVTGFEEVETGTILIVTPQVNPASGTVTLTVKPEISEILGFKGQFDERPIVASRRAETTVRLNDGETLVIGGLVSEKTEEVISKIPILGDAPFFGWFFKSKNYEKRKSSLYIFVTPRIVTDQGYRDRAKRAAQRLVREGLKGVDTASDDIRKPGASPFE